MTDGAIKLDMYLSVPTETVFTALGEHPRDVLEEHGIDLDGTFAARFAAGEVYGITLATAPEGRYRYLPTVVADSPDLPTGYCYSLLITSAKGGLASPVDFNPARHRAVINETGSFSGSVTLIPRRVRRRAQRRCQGRLARRDRQCCALLDDHLL